MFAKLFSSIYDGTLAEDWRALITFQQLLILCDRDGVIDMTPAAISRRTGIPIEHIKAGLQVLEADDPNSRTPDQNGKRVIRLNGDRAWGWKVVNYEKYREIRNADDRREYMRKYMRSRREKEDGNQGSCKQLGLTDVNSKQELAKLADAYASASGIKFRSRKGVKRGTTIPDDFVLTDDLVAYAERQGIRNRKTLERYTEDFIDQCHAKDYRYADFKAVWRKWLRKDIRDGKIAKDPPVQTRDF